MDPTDITVITDRGLPLLIASGVFAAVKLLRTPIVQSFLPARFRWENWDKRLAASIVLLSTAAGAMTTALVQGTPLSAALTTSVVAALTAMGIDAGHGAIKEPESSAKAAASIKIDMPSAKP